MKMLKFLNSFYFYIFLRIGETLKFILNCSIEYLIGCSKKLEKFRKISKVCYEGLIFRDYFSWNERNS